MTGPYATLSGRAGVLALATWAEIHLCPDCWRFTRVWADVGGRCVPCAERRAPRNLPPPPPPTARLRLLK